MKNKMQIIFSRRMHGKLSEKDNITGYVTICYLNMIYLPPIFNLKEHMDLKFG